MPDMGIQTIQFVLFKTSVDGESAAAIYKRFVGAEPDNSQTNRALSPAQPFLSLAQGTLDERFYNVQVGPGRIDFIVAHPDRPSTGPWAWKFAEGLRLFDQFVDRMTNDVVPKMGNTVRLAINVTLLRNCGSIAEANDTVLERVAVPQLLGATDINLQFNRRAASTVGGHSLNRLIRFAISSTREFLISPTGQPSFASAERFIATFLADINTVPSGKEIDGKTGAELLVDLARHCRVIIQNASIDALDVDDGTAQA